MAAKRLSSMFSLSKDGSGPAVTPSHSRDSSLNQSPTTSRLQKHASNSSAETNPHSQLPPLVPLAPPPLMYGDGFRPPSSAGSGSLPGSRASSPQSAPSRSRPQTPTIIVPETDTTSPARPLTPTSEKLNKRKSWLPRKSDKQKAEERKNAKAWIAGLRDFVNYDVAPLLTGDRVSCIGYNT